ncbi:uncharacterized protein LOC143249978 [Tachypleus tridentatus]|uniref:uncharacterized protein LOC143249978 n=1 Tax=Tachypleus tridentatus TaxID=6853 RepID=UPI003FD299C3
MSCKQVLHAYEACTDETFDSSGEFVTLTTKIPSTAGCPLIGVYKIKESKPQFSELVISDSNDHLCTEWSVLSAACNKYDTLDFQMKCSSETRVKSFQCHGSWEQNGTQYLIVSVPDTREQYCMAFTEEDKLMYLSSSAQTCVQTLNLYNSGNKVFSITDKGNRSIIQI